MLKEIEMSVNLDSTLKI